MTHDAGAGGRRASADIIRQAVVAVSLVIAVVGSLIGSGALGGTPIAQAAGGALSATGTLIAPAVPAFSIWSVIYVGLAAYAVWQLLPAQRASLRQRSLGYWIAASLVLNAAWILSVQAGLLALSVVVIVVLLAVLAQTYRLCIRSRSRGWVEALLVDGVVGLYLGWVAVATGANVTAGLQQAGFDGWGAPAEVWSVAIIVVVGLIGVLLAVADRGAIAPTLSLAWGLVWIAVARLTGTPHSSATAVAALVAVGLIIVTTLVTRLLTVRPDVGGMRPAHGSERASRSAGATR
jgi:hypothetical protein